MTVMIQDRTNCAICGRKAWQSMMASTSVLEPPDLDLRPGEPMRSTIGTWVQRCPRCGYCAPEISEFIDGAPELIKTASYKNQLRSTGYPELANSFLCLSMLWENAKDFAQAGLSSVYAAWVCDDRNREKAAAKCRLRAVELLRKARESQQRYAENEDQENAIMVDLLRRAGQFDEALRYCEESIPNCSDTFILKILNFQVQLIRNSDQLRHRVSEIEGL